MVTNFVVSVAFSTIQIVQTGRVFPFGPFSRARISYILPYSVLSTNEASFGNMCFLRSSFKIDQVSRTYPALASHFDLSFLLLGSQQVLRQLLIRDQCILRQSHFSPYQITSQLVQFRVPRARSCPRHSRHLHYPLRTPRRQSRHLRRLQETSAIIQREGGHDQPLF